MATVMKASEFIAKLKDIHSNYKTLYVMGCFGAPMTAANKRRYTTNHSYNKQANRTSLINAASTDTFGFDCVNLIKAVLWGWNGDKTKTYGGAKYCANGVPDIDANTMIAQCSGVTTDFSKIEVGEAVWCKDHIGVYIGDGLAIECTPAWKNRVQITAVKNIGTKDGYSARIWTKHGKLPYIDYNVETKPAKKPTATQTAKVDAAACYSKNYAGTYKVNTAGLNIRTGANVKKTSLGILSRDTVVRCYGYYSVAPNGVKWLYVMTGDGTTGFCSSAYLKKC